MFGRLVTIGVLTAVTLAASTLAYGQVAKSTKDVLRAHESAIAQLEREYFEQVEALNAEFAKRFKAVQESSIAGLGKVTEEAMEAKELDEAVAARDTQKRLKELTVEPPVWISKFERRDLIGKVVHVYWQAPVEYRMNKNGTLARIDGGKINPNESFWRVNDEGQIEFLDKDGKTVTSECFKVRSAPGTFGVGKHPTDGSPRLIFMPE